MIKIYTLGNFDIRTEDESILNYIGSNIKLIKLFKYFLTFQGKKLLPYKIIEDIWQDEDYEDPIGVLRTQISRVRSLFVVNALKVEPFFQIRYIDGYYVFELKENCWVDFIELEFYIKLHQSPGDKEKSLDIGRKIFDLYRGEYLGELGSDLWVIPIRSRYSRLFINSLTKHLQILDEMSVDNNIICLCEELICLFPYEEIIHIYYIESLVNLGQIRAALNHYVYYTSMMYNELGASPSERMISVYKSIRLKENNIHSNIELNTLDNELKDCDYYNGALVCDNYYFKFLYNFKSRIKERGDQKIFVGVVTIEKSGHTELSQEDVKHYMTILLEIIRYGLRKGDTITQWNHNQILVMLMGLGEENLDFLIGRLKETFKNMINNEKLDLNIKLKKL